MADLKPETVGNPNVKPTHWAVHEGCDKMQKYRVDAHRHWDIFRGELSTTIEMLHDGG